VGARVRTLAAPTRGSAARLRLSAAGDREWLAGLEPPPRDLPADWRPLAAGVWGLDLTATGRPEGMELAAAAGDVEALLDRPGEWGAGGGSERAAVEDSGGSESSTPK
jgi:hypothetical protein